MINSKLHLKLSPLNMLSKSNGILF